METAIKREKQLTRQDQNDIHSNNFHLILPNILKSKSPHRKSLTFPEYTHSKASRSIRLEPAGHSNSPSALPYSDPYSPASDSAGSRRDLHLGTRHSSVDARRRWVRGASRIGLRWCQSSRMWRRRSSAHIMLVDVKSFGGLYDEVSEFVQIRMQRGTLTSLKSSSPSNNPNSIIFLMDV